MARSALPDVSPVRPAPVDSERGPPSFLIFSGSKIVPGIVGGFPAIRSSPTASLPMEDAMQKWTMFALLSTSRLRGRVPPRLPTMR